MHIPDTTKSYILGIIYFLIFGIALGYFCMILGPGIMFLVMLEGFGLYYITSIVILSSLVSTIILRSYIKVTKSLGRFLLAASVLPLLFMIQHSLVSYFAGYTFGDITAELLPLFMYIMILYFSARFIQRSS